MAGAGGPVSGIYLSISWLAVRLIARPSGCDKEEAMKYVMLLYQGPALERQAALVVLSRQNYERAHI
jgi:hypothetical protein